MSTYRILSDKKINRAIRMNKVVKDYFHAHPAIKEIAAIKLMPLFISEGIFTEDYDNGYPLKYFLRQVERNQKLSLIEYAGKKGEGQHRKWYFTRQEI